MKSPLIRRIICTVAAVLSLYGGSSSVRASDTYATAVQALNPLVYYKLGETPAVVPTWVATNLGSAGDMANGVYLGDLQNTELFIEPFLPGPISSETNEGGVEYTAAGGYGTGVAIGWSTNINPFPAMTAECWVNYQGGLSGELTAPFASICGSSSGYVGTGRSGWTFYANGNAWNWRMGDTSGYIANFNDVGNIVVGVWMHLVGVCDGTNAFLYENGVLVGQQALARPFFGNTGETTDIGTSSSFNRIIDAGVADCAIYPYALSSNQVAAHYAAGIATSPSTPYAQVILNDQPVGFWRLNDGAFTSPPTNTYPQAVNSGTLGTNANGLYMPGTRVGAAGVAFPGFGSDTNAAYFNGALSGIEIPAIDVQTDSFTFAGWIMSTDPQEGNTGDPGYPALFCQGDVDSYLTADDVYVGYYGNDGTGYAGAVLTTLWTDGNTNPVANTADFGLESTPLALPLPFVWNFVAAVWSPSGTTLYVNGQAFPITKASTHSSHDFSQAPLWLAASDNIPLAGEGTNYTVGVESGLSCDWTYEGYMAHPALFASALTASQIQALYAAAMPLAQITSLTQSPLGPNYEGETITLTVTTIGPGVNTYQWLEGGSPAPGSASAASYVLSNVTVGNSGVYSVVVSNAYGAVTSSPIALSIVATAPVITSQPKPATRYPTSSATFNVSAIGSTPITYAWSLNSSPISGATNSSFTAVAGPATAGNYSVLLSNPHGSTPSSNALLTVLPAPSGYVAAVVAAQPLAYWRFNEPSNSAVAFDYVGGNDGNIVEGITNAVPGPEFPGLESNNLSYGFNGIGSKVRVPNPIPINSNTITTVALAQYTTSQTAFMPPDACILVSTRGPNDVAYFGVGATVTDLGYDWNDNTNTINFDPGDGGGGTNWVFTPGTWCFVAEAISATNAVLYMDNGDGHLAAVSNYVSYTGDGVLVTNAVLPLNGEVDLGGDANLNTGDNRTWAGGLDEIAYWKRTLSFSEISALHTALMSPLLAPTVSASVSGTTIQISFSGGTLQSSTNLSAGFTDVPGNPTSPYTLPLTSPAQFFRVKN
jgi:hypothetical protein